MERKSGQTYGKATEVAMQAYTSGRHAVSSITTKQQQQSKRAFTS